LQAFTRRSHHANVRAIWVGLSCARDTARSCVCSRRSPPRAANCAGAGRVSSLGEQRRPSGEQSGDRPPGRHRRAQRTPLRLADRGHPSPDRRRSDHDRSTSRLDARRQRRRLGMAGTALPRPVPINLGAGRGNCPVACALAEQTDSDARRRGARRQPSRACDRSSADANPTCPPGGHQRVGVLR
jgi:hypothetical protein